jgi:hypothetical protein
MQQPVPFVTKVRGEVFAHFHALAVNVTGVCGIGCSACQDEFFVNTPLDVTENDEHALAFPRSALNLV